MRRISKVMGIVISMGFFAVLLSACGDGGSGNSSWVGVANTAGSQSYSDEVVIQLEWARSFEDPEGMPFSTLLGGAVSDGLKLDLDAPVVFDNGEHTPDANRDATPVDIDWASWRQWRGGCRKTYEVRHLQATFTIPVDSSRVVDLILFSPYYTDHGDIIPINDNAYVFLNGTFIGAKGTSYGASRAPGDGIPFDFANETDGWYADGGLGSNALEALQPGLNVLDIVAEEWCEWGGIGRLDLKLLVEDNEVEPIEVPVDIKPQSCPNPLNLNSKGVLPVAILGTGTFDVTEVDPDTVLLEGVAPLRWALEDVATPFEPFTGKEDCFEDCTTEGADGYLDLTFKFDRQEVVAALGSVEDRQCLVLHLTGALYDDTPIIGEDVVLILKKGKQ